MHEGRTRIQNPWTTVTGSGVAAAAAAIVLVLLAVAETAASSPAIGPSARGTQPVDRGLSSHVDVAELMHTGGRSRPALPEGRSRDVVGRTSGAAVGAPDVGPPNRAQIEALPADWATMSTSSDNWAGYVAGPGPFTVASGTFTVPGLAATPTQTMTSEWVGIDGVAPSTTLIQAGVNEAYDPASNRVMTEAWWEILPDDPTNVLIPWSQLSVLPGHSVYVALETTRPDRPTRPTRSTPAVRRRPSGSSRRRPRRPVARSALWASSRRLCRSLTSGSQGLRARSTTGSWCKKEWTLRHHPPSHRATSL